MTLSVLEARLPAIGTAALPLAAASEAQAHTITHAPHHLSLKEGCTGAPGAPKKNESRRNHTGF